MPRLEKEKISLRDQFCELQKEHQTLQDRLSEFEAAKVKLQASQRYAEELEAERDDYKEKLSNSNAFIMHYLHTQVCCIL